MRSDEIDSGNFSCNTIKGSHTFMLARRFLPN
jgi:hypothetical protein